MEYNQGDETLGEGKTLGEAKFEVKGAIEKARRETEKIGLGKEKNESVLAGILPKKLVVEEEKRMFRIA